jgi:5-(carboxyamino)imidazole ribonucleotide synthase
MLAMAAAKLGYKVAVLGPGGRQSPAGHVAYWAEAWSKDNNVSGKLLYEFCKLVSVVMIEWENIPLDVVQRIETIGIPVRPSSDVLAIAQDRLLEKQCARALGIPVPKFWNIERIEDWWEDCWDSTTACILKTRCNGYDGKGQGKFQNFSELEIFLKSQPKIDHIVEQIVNFSCEISVVACRFQSGKMLFYPPSENTHKNHILDISIHPARVSDEIKSKAMEATRVLLTSLNYVGVLALEFFVTEKDVICNEFAPRPHNSGHFSMDAARFSQFELQLLTLCNLESDMDHLQTKTCVMKNIIGFDFMEKEKMYTEFLMRNDYRLHLYQKDEAKIGRKMGHWNYLGNKSYDAAFPE